MVLSCESALKFSFTLFPPHCSTSFNFVVVIFVLLYSYVLFFFGYLICWYNNEQLLLINTHLNSFLALLVQQYVNNLWVYPVLFSVNYKKKISHLSFDEVLFGIFQGYLINMKKKLMAISTNHKRYFLRHIPEITYM